jgi:hypothetical protein
MASLSSKIKAYASSNGVSSVDFMKDVSLQDDSDGKGPYIKAWNLAISQPTDAELTAAETAADAAEALAAVHSARRTAYGSVESQLDMQYHDNVDGTTTWKDHVAKVKTDNPKS